MLPRQIVSARKVNLSSRLAFRSLCVSIAEPTGGVLASVLPSLRSLCAQTPPAASMNSLPRSKASTGSWTPVKIPQHVAIIMDGNGRWAGKRMLKRFLGHQQGAESVQFVVETASRIDLPWLTLYAFSTRK